MAIPTSGMENGDFFFRRCLDSLWNQSEQDFEIVVTDNSEDDIILEICNWYRTGIRYIKNPQKGMAQNTNEAIRQSKGELIKILYMDDFLAHDQAIENIIKKCKNMWLVTGCTHVSGTDEFRTNPHRPRWSKNIHLGNNTIGSPSVLTIRNQDPLLFDENMTWLLDCDYYKRLYEKYGKPSVINDINVAIGLHKGQATHTMGEDRKLQEYEYIKKKYA